MSVAYQELTVTVYGRDLASAEFNKVTESAKTSAASMKALARDVASLGASAVAVGRLGEMFGMLTEEQAETITTMGSMVALAGTVVRGYELIASSSIGAAVAQKAMGVATWFANQALITQISFMTLGVGAIAAATAAVWALSQANQAASRSAEELKRSMEGIGEGNIPGRSIYRSGQEELYRRGVE